MNTSPLDPAFHPGAGVTEPTLAASLRGGGGITPAAHPTLDERYRDSLLMACVVTAYVGTM